LKKTNSGIIWPYAIGLSIFLVILAGATTIMITANAHVEDSDRYMMGYHEADAKANELIEAKIAFDKKYKLKLLSDSLHPKSSTLAYEITTSDGEAVNDAKIKLIVTRPNIHKYDQELSPSTIKNGIYTFSNIKLAKEGRWDIMAKIELGDNSRFYNVKMDTRSKGAYEY
jgi:hypothetical protein